ncbi:MAG: hypothetical protein WCE30_24835 [Mycobacterium sp.]
MTTHFWRSTVAGMLAAGVVLAGSTAGAGLANADVIADIDQQYDIGSSGGEISQLIHSVVSLRSQGFGPSKGNMSDIQAALDQRPNEMPLIQALKDTLAFQKRNKSRASGAQPQNPGIVIGGTPGGLPPGLVPNTGGSSISLGG